MAIKLAIVDDNNSLRKNFRKQASFYPELVLVGDYSSGEQAIDEIKKISSDKRPDIILMDIELPKMSGIETTIVLKELLPDVEILMLTVFEHNEKIFQSIQAGASGYILKDESFDEIVGAIKDLQSGGAPMSPSIAQKVLGMLRTKSSGQQLPRTDIPEPLEFSLSDRERQLLDGLVRGDTYTVLAEKLFISPHTVRTHIKNIYKKLHVHSRATAVRVALERRLV